MKRFIIFFIIFLINCSAYSFPIPKNNKVTFDIIRKNKIIGSVETIFNLEEGSLIVETNVNVEIKALFIPVYKFSQETREVWQNGNFIKFKGHTDFEDEREYFIKGQDTKNNFVAFGMDGELKLDKNILPLNYWNKDILKEKELFDTQKGIVRKINVKKIGNEIIKINNKNIDTEKYLFNASKNPKDKGPFPEYTLWYATNDELVKFRFLNWKDNKEVITQRNDWGR